MKQIIKDKIEEISSEVTDSSCTNNESQQITKMLDELKVAINKNALLPDVSGSLRFTANDVDGAYLLGIFNSSGMDGLAKELQRLKKFGMNPSTMLDWLKHQSNDR